MSAENICIGDTVKHISKNDEMLVIEKDRNWVICEFMANDGERIVKAYDKDCLVIIEKKPSPSLPNINISTDL